jgi:hypothetical protein
VTVIINPGTGPCNGAYQPCAEENLQKFIEDLGLKEPDVTVKPYKKIRPDDRGYFDFTLVRGQRKCEVSMPGIPLAEARWRDGANPWNFQRLYIDGSSWLWEFAEGFARSALMDHDKAIEKRIKASEKRCEAELDENPRCTTCGMVRQIHQLRGASEDEEGEYTLVCLTCKPVIDTARVSMRDAVYLDDGWKGKDHYIVRWQDLPPEVPGHEDPRHPDALCGAYVGSNQGSCRLKRGHTTPCESYRKKISSVFVAAKDAK